MGFFSKIKQGFNQMVGNTGNMQIMLTAQQVARGGSVNVSLVLNATGELKGNSVNVEVTGTETVKYQVPVASTTGTTPVGSAASAGSPAMQADATTTTEMTDETKDNQTYTNRQILDGTAFVMNQGETRNYTATVQIPPGVQPTYMGVDAVHVWKIRAYVDVPMGADIEAVAEVTVT